MSNEEKIAKYTSINVCIHSSYDATTIPPPPLPTNHSTAATGTHSIIDQPSLQSSIIASTYNLSYFMMPGVPYLNIFNYFGRAGRPCIDKIICHINLIGVMERIEKER